MSESSDDHNDAKRLFRQAMANVRPLKSDRVSPFRKRPRPRPTQTLREQQRVMQDMLSDPVDPADLETGEELFFCRDGLQHGLLKRLRRGQFRVERELDLHGKTSLEARHLLAEFLKRCTRDGARVVRVIHGKGLGSHNKIPVLKGKVSYWLRQRDEVLAFCSARPIDGGTGAVYVLLKRQGTSG